MNLIAGGVVGWLSVILMLASAVIGEVIEAVLGSLVAGKYGATKWGMLGALAGGTTCRPVPFMKVPRSRDESCVATGRTELASQQET
mgnify:CR=1 FL=1